jgi:hypothetical protein
MPDPHPVSIDSVVTAEREQLSSNLAGEAVILDLKAGVYYGLNAVGARIWSLLQRPRPVHEIRYALLQEYEAGSAQCEADLLAALGDMAAAGLIRVQGSAPVPCEGPDPGRG